MQWYAAEDRGLRRAEASFRLSGRAASPGVAPDDEVARKVHPACWSAGGVDAFDKHLCAHPGHLAAGL